MHAVVTHLISYPEAQAVWIDTEGEFSPALLKEVIILRLLPSETCITVESILDRVQIMRVLDIQGISEVVDELEQTYKEKDAERVLQKLSNYSGGQEGDKEHPMPAEGDSKGLGDPGIVVVDTIYQPLSELMDSEAGGFLDQDAWAFENEKPENGDPWCRWIEALPSPFITMEETPALGPVYAECVDLSVMISKYPHDPKLTNSQESQSAGPPDYKNKNAAGLAVMIKDMELAGFKLGNVMTVMSDRNGSRNGMFACFDIDGVRLVDIVVSDADEDDTMPSLS
ncbi:hypothetical protein Q9L58_008128 [Maublancomyces gigas]|uniref:DNA recombination and repair protein Rad51-like C-terminal domain-containing protein n=1 Tax=Discina gigas TaxID=1032678 RepID=A0ABR3GAK0_9PEZI